jgi:hypothetical protein
MVTFSTVTSSALWKQRTPGFKPSWKSSWYQLVMSGKAAMILSVYSMHPTTSGCTYQGYMWVEPSSRSIGRYPIQQLYVICISCFGVVATPTGIGLMSCTSMKRDWSFPRQILAPVLARRFACMASHRTMVSPSNNPTIQKTLRMRTTVSKWKAAATSARVESPFIHFSVMDGRES